MCLALAAKSNRKPRTTHIHGGGVVTPYLDSTAPPGGADWNNTLTCTSSQLSLEPFVLVFLTISNFFCYLITVATKRTVLMS